MGKQAAVWGFPALQPGLSLQQSAVPQVGRGELWGGLSSLRLVLQGCRSAITTVALGCAFEQRADICAFVLKGWLTWTPPCRHSYDLS